MTFMLFLSYDYVADFNIVHVVDDDYHDFVEILVYGYRFHVCIFLYM